MSSRRIDIARYGFANLSSLDAAVNRYDTVASLSTMLRTLSNTYKPAGEDERQMFGSWKESVLRHRLATVETLVSDDVPTVVTFATEPRDDDWFTELSV